MELAKFYSERLVMDYKKITHNGKTKWMCFGNDRRIIFSSGKNKKLDFAAFSFFVFHSKVPFSLAVN